MEGSRYESGLEVRPYDTTLPQSMPAQEKEVDQNVAASYYHHDSTAVLPHGEVRTTYPEDEEPRQRPKVYGMSPLTFAALVATVTAIIVGAALGGGLGSQLASCSGSSEETLPSSTSSLSDTAAATTTVTAPQSTRTNSEGELIQYAPAPPAEISALQDDCPDIDASVDTTTPRRDSYDVSCANDLQGGDLMSFWCYRWQDCIGACSAMNNYQSDETPCQAVQFNPFMTELNDQGRHGNCFLKTGNYSLGHREGRVSATLVK